jgi:DNA repair protein RecO
VDWHPLIFMYRTRAFVLEKIERGEADYLVTLYTEQFGFLKGLAQGLRKPAAKLQGHLELFSETEVSLVLGRNGYRLTGALLIGPYQKLHASLPRIAVAEAAAAIVRTVAFHGEDNSLWLALERFYKGLEAKEFLSEAELAQGLLWFAVQVLTRLGYQLSHDSEIANIAEIREALRSYEECEVAQSFKSPTSPYLTKLLWRAISHSYEKNLGYRFLFFSQKYAML